MSTLSVPLSSVLEKFIQNMVKSGQAASKADVVRRALIQYREDQVFKSLSQASQEAKEGKVFEGDLDELAKKLRV